MSSLRVTPSPRSTATVARPRHRPTWGRHVVGGFYLMMAGVHLGLVSADTEVYRPFADQGLFAFVRNGWQDIVMQHPAFWGLCLMTGEAVIGVLLLLGRRTARVGWVLVVVFHLLLMLFGFGIWLWSLPALALVWYLARADFDTGTEASS
jgi:hypothetical protein